MTKASFVIILVILSLTTLIQCKNDKHTIITAKDIYRYDGNRLIEEKYDSLGLLEMRKYFTKDTIPDRAESHFYPNGRLARWIWFDAKRKNPYAEVYYDTNGIYKKYKGYPIINAVKSEDKETYIQMINPPGVKFVIKYLDSCGNTLIKKDVYFPGLTDSTAWVKLDEKHFDDKHNYTISYFFVILDEKNKTIKPIDSFSNKLSYRDL